MDVSCVSGTTLHSNWTKFYSNGKTKPMDIVCLASSFAYKLSLNQLYFIQNHFRHFVEKSLAKESWDVVAGVRIWAHTETFNDHVLFTAHWGHYRGPNEVDLYRDKYRNKYRDKYTNTETFDDLLLFNAHQWWATTGTLSRISENSILFME